jgi:DNA helicase-2/ATP-dependent DNA helicase PcrA
LKPSELPPKAIELLEAVGRAVPSDQGLDYFLGQLAPVAKDIATQSDAVRIMTMSASKGLTVNTCVVLGVEQGILPHPRGKEDEERRLLYVSMTRATDMCVLTFAGQRKGPIARQGNPNVNYPRERSPLLATLPDIGNWQDGGEVIEELRRGVQAANEE